MAVGRYSIAHAELQTTNEQPKQFRKIGKAKFPIR